MVRVEYRAGTLTYTKPALVILLFWLFWGDFCFTVMEAVTGPIMQLKFQKLQASNTEIGLIIVTIPSLIYTILLPIISFKSDRFRSRLGRRIPFLLFSLPFLVALLFIMAFGENLGRWLFAHVPFLHSLSANQAVIMVLGGLLILFTFFNTFTNSTFWYLFNDVVPEHLLARFMAWFRTISMLSTSFYSFFIFPYSATHSTEIFVGAGFLYLTGFGLMCYFVREGKYPPPPPYIGGRTGPLAAILTYVKETHAFPHYWYLWICTFFGAIGGGTAYLFALFYYLAIGLNTSQIGAINGTNTVVVGLFTLAAGWLADRYHPIRVVLWGNIINTFIVTPTGLLWLFWHPSASPIFWVIMTINIVIGGPGAAMGGMWDPPMLMRLFPRLQYGQFCSINGVWRSMGGILGGVMLGEFLDFISRWVGKEHAYYYLPAWTLFFGMPSFYLFVKLYFSWKKLGGDENYEAPVLSHAERGA